MDRFYQKKKSIFLLALVIILEFIIYAPHVGTGFVTDDFTLLENVVVNGKVDYLKPFTITTGFYRPFVSLSFGFQYDIHGMNPRPYGLFNLFLHLLNIIMIYLVLSFCKISRPYALPATILFALNSKGVIMAVGWISGRSTLLFSFFMLLSLYLYLKVNQHHFQQGWNNRRVVLYLLVNLTYLAALLSKESAAAAPVFVFLFSFFFQDGRYRVTSSPASLKRFRSLQTAFLSTLIFILPLMIYFFLRLKSNAITPFNAPDFYSYTLAKTVLLKNFWEYITRACLLDLFIAAWLIIVVFLFRKTIKPGKSINSTALMSGALWFLCFLLPMFPLVVRSDIYIYLPQVGLHLTFLAFISHMLGKMDLTIKKRRKQYIILLPIGILLFTWIGHLFVSTSIYGREGNSSTLFTQQLLKKVSKIKDGSKIWIIDTNEEKRLSPSGTISYGFYSLLKLYYPQKHLRGEIILPCKVGIIKCDKNAFIFFFWGNGQLSGSYNCTELRDLLTSFYPYSSVQQEKMEKQKKPVRKKLNRLKERKKRLKRVRKNIDER